MPIERTSSSQDRYSLRQLDSQASHEDLFVDVQTIGSQDKDLESSNHVRTFHSGMFIPPLQLKQLNPIPQPQASQCVPTTAASSILLNLSITQGFASTFDDPNLDPNHTPDDDDSTFDDA